jgi:hypothetical protein
VKGTLAQVRTYERSVQLLMVNQFTINLGFYILMPYLAAHLSGTLGLAGWLVGLVLGVRNFSQQGMFLVGGTLADRFGYKPMIVAGCVLRTVGFATLGLVDSLAALIAASAATGLAGALFNPAVRSRRGRGGAQGRGVRAVQRLLPGRDPAGPAGGHGADRGGLPHHLPGVGRDLRTAQHRADPRPARPAG